MLFPLCTPLRIASVVIAEFFEPRLCASMLAATNWPRVSLGLACRADSNAVWSASGVMPSLVAIPLNESLPFGCVAAFEELAELALGFDGCDIGVVRTRGLATCPARLQRWPRPTWRRRSR